MEHCASALKTFQQQLGNAHPYVDAATQMQAEVSNRGSALWLCGIQSVLIERYGVVVCTQITLEQQKAEDAAPAVAAEVDEKE